MNIRETSGTLTTRETSTIYIDLDTICTLLQLKALTKLVERLEKEGCEYIMIEESCMDDDGELIVDLDDDGDLIVHLDDEPDPIVIKSNGYVLYSNSTIYIKSTEYTRLR